MIKRRAEGVGVGGDGGNEMDGDDVNGVSRFVVVVVVVATASTTTTSDSGSTTLVAILLPPPPSMVVDVPKEGDTNTPGWCEWYGLMEWHWSTVQSTELDHKKGIS